VLPGYNPHWRPLRMRTSSGRARARVRDGARVMGGERGGRWRE